MSGRVKCLSHANLYLQYRPEPPAVVIERITDYVKSKIKRPLDNAVDIGCGSGQSTLVLAPYFKQVTGFDVSEEQVQLASERRSTPNVHYRSSVAECLDASDSSVDLVTACQALHWFDLPKVFSEVGRILVPGGVFAAYGHWIPLPNFESPLKTEEARKLIIDYFYNDQVGKYFSPENRKKFESNYDEIEFPFTDCIRDKKIVTHSVCTVSNYIGYLSSWSTYQAFLKEHPNEAQAVLEGVKEKLMSILEAKCSPEVAVLNLCTNYFLIMGRKKESP